MSKALVVVDWQEEWRTPESEEYVGELKEETAKVKTLIDYCRSKGIPVIFVRHLEEGSEEGFSGKRASIMHELEVGDSKVVNKSRVSPFYRTNLEEALRETGADEIIVAGILTNLCVRSLASGAYDRDYKVTVIKDCCVAFSKEIHEFTLQDLEETRGINIVKLENFII